MIRFFYLFFLLLFSCQTSIDHVSHSVFKMNIEVDPCSLDPRKTHDLRSINLVSMLFEGLTRFSREGNIELALAKSYTVSEDGLEYTFHLRDSSWSNANPVTAFDFVRSFKSTLDPLFPTGAAFYLYVLKNARSVKLCQSPKEELGVFAPNENTLVIQLERPIPYFLELLSQPAFFPVPKEALENPNWAFQENFVCNGPFILSCWKHSDEIKLSCNSHYWQADEIKIKEVDLLMMAPDTEMQLFEEGKLHWAGSPFSTVPIASIPFLKQNQQLEIKSFLGTQFLRVNTREKVKGEKNPLSSSFFRKALAFCLDRHAIVTHTLQGGQKPAKSLTPPEMQLFSEGAFEESVFLAKSYLEKALLDLGIAFEDLPKIEVQYVIGERNREIAQILQKEWKKHLNLEVELLAVETKTHFEQIAGGYYQLALGSWIADFNDPINFLEVFKYKDQGSNHTEWQSEKYIGLLEDSDNCFDRGKRQDLLKKAEELLFEEMPIIPIFHYSMNYLRDKRLQNVILSSGGRLDIRWAYFEDEPKRETL